VYAELGNLLQVEMPKNSAVFGKSKQIPASAFVLFFVLFVLFISTTRT